MKYCRTLRPGMAVAAVLRSSFPRWFEQGFGLGLWLHRRGGSIFTSMQALGRKLESRKAPMALIAVDRVEKMPTEN